MSSWIVLSGVALLGLVTGFGIAVLAVRGRLRRLRGFESEDPLRRLRSSRPRATAEPEDDLARARMAGLVATALREPLARLRRTDTCPPDLLERLEHLAWQCRMLTSPGRPMKALPTSPADLLQRVVEEVDPLRLGKVGVSWSLRDRQPVHADSERTAAAFRELLASAAALEGEGGRIAIRIHPSGEPRFPIRVEIETGRRSGELDPLALHVARQLIEAQGARFEHREHLICVLLPNIPPEEDESPNP